MNSKADFSDLMPRIVSAVVLVSAGLGCILLGGVVFGFFLIAVAALLGWETSRMHSRNKVAPYVYGLEIAALASSVMFLPAFWTLCIAGLVMVTALFFHHTRLAVVLTTIVIAITCTTLFVVRTRYGFEPVMWLVLVVVASDVGGYFAGKLIGGWKLLPVISPQKTWSGTLGGLALAAVVGTTTIQMDMSDLSLILMSVLIAIAAQIGDLFESVMKRKADVKDSSNLIPGHGGLLDRFDGLMGASVAFGLVLALGNASLLGLS